MLSHIEIYVRDIEKTRKFYDVLLPRLGYVVYQEWSEGFSYRDGDSYIVFVQTRDKYMKNGYNRCNIGLNHIAYKCGSKREIDDLREFLKKEGVTLLYDDKYPFAGGTEHYAFYFEDPDRIKVEIVFYENI
ncbi:MAG: VOC family protein [Leptotrichiaceae bacterium]|nr:VOC family protein [Leptotrichiaceae bacterium]